MDEDTELDPRIQVELENLNTATDEINKLEIELEEANSTFRILLNESTRRLKLLTKKLGSCIEKARPYYDALEKARIAQIDCQTAAVKFQRANEIHAAAKETVALAEQRFMSNSHEWQFDNAWQEMLNHATIKVMDAEKQKAESHAEHQAKAMIFSQAEVKVQQQEEKYRRSIHKSRPYFEEKQICQDQLQTQKERIQVLQNQIQSAKTTYSNSLKKLEEISEEIHRKRGDSKAMGCGRPSPPPGPREPGVGAELTTSTSAYSISACDKERHLLKSSASIQQLPDYNSELDRCEIRSVGTSSVTTSSAVSEKDDNSDCDDNTIDDSTSNNDLDLEELKRKVKVLAIRPVEGGDGQQEQDIWENELNATVNKLDQLMMLRECYNNGSGGIGGGVSNSITNIVTSLPSTPLKLVQSPIKRLNMADPLPLLNVSMNVLPTNSSTTLTGVAAQQPNYYLKGIAANGAESKKFITQKRRKLSE